MKKRNRKKINIGKKNLGVGRALLDLIFDKKNKQIFFFKEKRTNS